MTATSNPTNAYMSRRTALENDAYAGTVSKLKFAGSIKKIPTADWPALVRLLGASTYLSDVLIREGKNWADVFLRQIKVKRKSAADHMKELAAEIHDTMSFDEFCAALRRHKQREYLRIGARDLMPSVTMEETVRELTALAEASLETPTVSVARTWRTSTGC